MEFVLLSLLAGAVILTYGQIKSKNEGQNR